MTDPCSCHLMATACRRGVAPGLEGPGASRLAHRQGSAPSPVAASSLCMAVQPMPKPSHHGVAPRAPSRAAVR
jgi:hypothetical protein